MTKPTCTSSNPMNNPFITKQLAIDGVVRSTRKTIALGAAFVLAAGALVPALCGCAGTEPDKKTKQGNSEVSNVNSNANQSMDNVESSRRTVNRLGGYLK